MKRIISLLLVLATFCALLISCNNEASKSTSTDTIQNADTNIDISTDTNTDTNNKDEPLHTDDVIDIINPDKEADPEKKYYFQRPYKSFSMRWTDEARLWQWEKLSAFEKYTTLKIGETKYFSQERLIKKELLGDYLGEYTAFGYEHEYSSDIFENGTSIEHTEVFKVYEIKDISKSTCVAVEINNKYYVYMISVSGTPKPKTLGEFLEGYNLEKTLPLNSFLYTKDKNNQRYKLEDDSYIWSILYSCKDAEIQNENSVGWDLTGDYVCFTATSEQLGAYKHVFYITENGYVKTNLIQHYSYHYYIGEENAQKIIDYALENATEGLNDEYEYDIVGIVTEITDDHMLIDDSTFCISNDDGMVFKVSTSEMKIKRKCGGIEVGDIVAVFFEREINQADNGIIDNPSTLSGCTMYEDGDLSVHARYE